MNAVTQRLMPSAGLRQEMAIAAIAAALFSLESWALGPLSWIYGYGSGLETIPALKALSFEGRNLSLLSLSLEGELRAIFLVLRWEYTYEGDCIGLHWIFAL